ncbi:MAG: Mu-like prophage major head subunit gpT family protein, partial [Desulfosalsimonadaceae bacterium]
IFYGSHVKLGGGTWSNLATASGLAYSTLQSAILAFENQTDHRGKKINQTPMVLLVPPALEMKALELLKSIGMPESANNEPNAVRLARPRLRMVVWPYLTSSTAWYLIGDNARPVSVLAIRLVNIHVRISTLHSSKSRKPSS